MSTRQNRVVVYGLLMLVGGAIYLIGRYAFAPHQPAAPATATHPVDLEQLSAKWAYPGSKTVNSGRSGSIVHAVTTSPDDIAKVASHYQTLVGRAILPIEGTSGGSGVNFSSGGGGGGTAVASVSVVDFWASGSPSRPRQLVLAAHSETGYSATVVLYRGADDDSTHIAVTITER
jgi:hypothetical protein